MTDRIDFSPLHDLLDRDRVDRVVAGAMHRIRSRPGVVETLGRFWFVSLGAAAAAVIVALLVPPAAPAPLSGATTPDGTLGYGLEIPAALAGWAGGAEPMSMHEAFIVLRPEGP